MLHLNISTTRDCSFLFSKVALKILNEDMIRSTGSDPHHLFFNRLWGMYKRSEPMGRLHSVQKHMANVYLPLQFKEVEMFREHTM